jgi:dTDP-4-amino-4,6-dideoxygalactose transaminase
MTKAMSRRLDVRSDPSQPHPAGALPGSLAPSRERIRYLRPDLPSLDELSRYYALSEERRWYSNRGPCNERFAKGIADYIGDVLCTPVSNCTQGLMVALSATCGEPAGDRRLIAVPSFTFTASACAIKWAGFEPLFVDIEPDSFQMDAGALAAALDAHEGRVAGVLGCSTFGTPAPSATRQGWRDACARHGLPLVIDSAAGFGALDDRGVQLGGQGETEVFSFHATKPFAIGEGGAIVTRQPAIAERVERLINFGIDPTLSASSVAGLNGKLSELHCAMGLAMLDRFPESLARRRLTAAALQAAVVSHPLRYQKGAEGSTWQGFHVLFASAKLRARAVDLARQELVEVRKCFDPPVHRHPAFASMPHGGLGETERIAARSLTFPIANQLGPRQIERIAELVDLIFAA